MCLESVESNEHSIRFKVTQEVPLLGVVEHILADAAQAGMDIAFGRARALELLHLGAVYVGIPQKGLDHINWVRSIELSVAVTAAAVPPGQYVRVHPKPKRYPACYCKDWPARIVHSDSDLLVVNKPAGLPCMRHESNAAEELAACVGRALGVEGLEACHRLDMWTTGVVVLSRHRASNVDFKRSLQEREEGLVKTYKALTYAPVPLGPLEHYMYDGPFGEGAPVLGGGVLRPRGPRLLSHTAHKRWRQCRMTVRECKEHPGALAWYRRHFPEPDADPAWAALAASLHPSAATPEPSLDHQTDRLAQLELAAVSPPSPPQPSPNATHQDQQGGQAAAAQGAPRGLGAPDPGAAAASHAVGGGPGPAVLYECTVELHTGRTHQIRAQLAAVGCPLVGDAMYAPIAGLLVGESGVLEDRAAVGRVEALPMQERHVGLHAWRLTWRGRAFEALPDWEA